MSYDHFALFLLWPLGRIEEALQQMRGAERADPRSHEIQRDLACGLCQPVDMMGQPNFASGCR
jgi:hypothetical protein